MRVSVVIPVFNEEKYIENCLQGLFDQEERADEIIVVDNNCTDKTVKLAKKFDVCIVREKKQGIIFARSRGFEAANGDIIARCDADTIIPKDWVKKIKKNFKNNIAALTGPVCYYDAPFTKLVSKLHTILFFRTTKEIFGYETIHGSNMAIKKTMWQKIRNKQNFDGSKIHEDIVLATHVSKYGKVKFDPTLLVATSARRILKTPIAIIEYPVMWVRSLIFGKR